MNIRAPIVFVLILALSGLEAMAQSPYLDLEQRLSAEQLHSTGLDTLSREQLELLNRLLREEAASKVVVEDPADSPRQDSRGYVGLDDGPIHSRLRGAIDGWQPGTVFVLENGQQWKVLKGSVKLREALQAPSIVVVPGIAGRWFLQIDEDLPKARVYRID